MRRRESMNEKKKEMITKMMIMIIIIIRMHSFKFYIFQCIDATQVFSVF